MCPLRLILIFLSATLAGFFVLRGLNSAKPDLDKGREIPDEQDSSSSSPCSAKIRSAISSVFWTCVDMASGRYLWRNLTAPSPSPSTSPADDSVALEKHQ